MNTKNKNTVMVVAGIILFIVCIATSIIAVKYGTELKGMMDIYKATLNVETSQAEVIRHNFLETKSSFMKYLSVSLLTFVGTMLDLAIVYMNKLKEEK